MQVSDIQVPKL